MALFFGSIFFFFFFWRGHHRRLLSIQRDSSFEPSLNFGALAATGHRLQPEVLTPSPVRSRSHCFLLLTRPSSALFLEQGTQRHTALHSGFFFISSCIVKSTLRYTKYSSLNFLVNRWIFLNLSSEVADSDFHPYFFNPSNSSDSDKEGHYIHTVFSKEEI